MEEHHRSFLFSIEMQWYSMSTILGLLDYSWFGQLVGLLWPWADGFDRFIEVVIARMHGLLPPGALEGFFSERLVHCLWHLISWYLDSSDHKYVEPDFLMVSCQASSLQAKVLSSHVLPPLAVVQAGRFNPLPFLLLSWKCWGHPSRVG